MIRRMFHGMFHGVVHGVVRGVVGWHASQDAQIQHHVRVGTFREDTRMAFALVFEQRVDEFGIQVVERGLRHDGDVVLGLALLLKQTVDLVGGHLAVAVAGADVGAAVRADRGDEAGLLARQHLVDDGEHQIRSLERAGHDHRTDHRREFLAGLAQRLLHRACVEVLDRREPCFLTQSQDDVPAVAVGERGQRFGNGGADLALAFLDLALLRIVADDAHQFDELGHLGRVVVVVHRASKGVPLSLGDGRTPAVLRLVPVVLRLMPAVHHRLLSPILCRRRCIHSDVGHICRHTTADNGADAGRAGRNASRFRIAREPDTIGPATGTSPPRALPPGMITRNAITAPRPSPA